MIDRRLNAIGGTSQSALLWVPLVCFRGVEIQWRLDEEVKPKCLRLEGKDIQEEVNEKVYLYSELKEIHENKLTA